MVTKNTIYNTFFVTTSFMLLSEEHDANRSIFDKYMYNNNTEDIMTTTIHTPHNLLTDRPDFRSRALWAVTQATFYQLNELSNDINRVIDYFHAIGLCHLDNDNLPLEHQFTDAEWHDISVKFSAVRDDVSATSANLQTMERLGANLNFYKKAYSIDHKPDGDNH